MSSYHRGRQYKDELNLTSSFIAGGYQYTYHPGTVVATYRFEENKAVDTTVSASLDVNDHSGHVYTARIITGSINTNPSGTFGNHLTQRVSTTTPFLYTKNTMKKSGLTDLQRLTTDVSSSGEQIRTLQFSSGTAERVEIPANVSTALSSITAGTLPRGNLYESGLTFSTWIRLDSSRTTFSTVASGTTLTNSNTDKSIFTALYGDASLSTYNNIGLSLRVVYDDSTNDGRLVWQTAHCSGTSSDIEKFKWHTKTNVPFDKWTHVSVLYPTASNIAGYTVNNKSGIKPQIYIDGRIQEIDQDPWSETASAQITFDALPLWSGSDPDGFDSFNILVDVPYKSNSTQQSLIQLTSQPITSTLPGGIEYVPHEVNLTLSSSALDNTQTGLNNHLSTFTLVDPVSENTLNFAIDMYSTCSVGNFNGYFASPQYIDPDPVKKARVSIKYSPSNPISSLDYNVVASSSIRLTTPNLTTKIYQFTNASVGTGSYDSVVLTSGTYTTQFKNEKFTTLIPTSDSSILSTIDTRSFRLYDNDINYVNFIYSTTESLPQRINANNYFISADTITNQLTHAGSLFDALMLARSNGDLNIGFATCSRAEVETHKIIPIIMETVGRESYTDYIQLLSGTVLTFSTSIYVTSSITSLDVFEGENLNRYYAAFTTGSLSHAFVTGSQVLLGSVLSTQNAYNYTLHTERDPRNNVLYKPFDATALYPVLIDSPVFIFGCDDRNTEHGIPENYASQRYIQTTKKITGDFSVCFKACPAESSGLSRETIHDAMLDAPTSSTHGLTVQVSTDGQTWYSATESIRETNVASVITNIVDTNPNNVNMYIQNYRNLTNGGRSKILPSDFSSSEWHQFKFYHTSKASDNTYRANIDTDPTTNPSYYVRILQESYSGYNRNIWALTDVYIIGNMEAYIITDTNDDIVRVKIGSDADASWTNLRDAVNSSLGHDGEITATIDTSEHVVDLLYESPIGIYQEGSLASPPLIDIRPLINMGLSYELHNSENVKTYNFDISDQLTENTHYRIGLKNITSVTGAYEEIAQIFNGIQDIPTGLQTVVADTDYLRIRSDSFTRVANPSIVDQPKTVSGTNATGWSIDGYLRYKDAIRVSIKDILDSAASEIDASALIDVADRLTSVINLNTSLDITAIATPPGTSNVLTLQHLTSSARSNDCTITNLNENMLTLGYSSSITFTHTDHSQFVSGTYLLVDPRGDLAQLTSICLGTPMQNVQHFYTSTTNPFGYDKPDYTFYEEYFPHLFGITPKCYLDDVTFFKRCLDTKEIRAIYNASRGSYRPKSGFANNNPRIDILQRDNRAGTYPNIRRHNVSTTNIIQNDPYDAIDEVLHNQSYASTVIEFTGVPTAYIKLVDWVGRIKSFHFTERTVQSTLTNLIVNASQGSRPSLIAENFVNMVNGGASLTGYKFGIVAELSGKSSVILKQTNPTSSGNTPIIVHSTPYSNRPYVLNAIVQDSFVGGNDYIESTFPLRFTKNHDFKASPISTPNAMPSLDFAVDNNRTCISYDHLGVNNNTDDPFIEDGQYESYSLPENTDIDVSSDGVATRTRDFYMTGTDPSHVGYGLNAPLTSKHKIVIDVNPVTKTSLFKHVTTGSTMAYYNFADKVWERLGNQQTGSYRTVAGGTDICASGLLSYTGMKDFDLIYNTPVSSSTPTINNSYFELTDVRGNNVRFIYNNSVTGSTRVNANKWYIPLVKQNPIITSDYDYISSSLPTVNSTLNSRTFTIIDSTGFEQLFIHTSSLLMTAPSLDMSNNVLIGIQDVTSSADHVTAVKLAVEYAVAWAGLTINTASFILSASTLTLDTLTQAEGGLVHSLGGTSMILDTPDQWTFIYSGDKWSFLDAVYSTIGASRLNDDLQIRITNPTTRPSISSVDEFTLRQMIIGPEGNSSIVISGSNHASGTNFTGGNRYIGKHASAYSLMSQSIDGERYGNANMRKWMDTVHIGFSPSIGLSVDNSATVLVSKLTNDLAVNGNAGKYMFENGGLASPVSTFGFPIHPKFQASNDQYINVSDYIDRPFLLEKIIYEFNGDIHESASIQTMVGGNTTTSASYGTSSTYTQGASLNIPTPTFFILNQRTCALPEGFTGNANVVSVIDENLNEVTQFNYSSSIPSSFSAPDDVSNISSIMSTRDLVTFGRFSIIPGSYNTGDFEEYVEDIRNKTDLPLVLQDSKLGLNNVVYTGSTTMLEIPVRSPQYNESICTFKTEGDFINGTRAEYRLEVSGNIASTFTDFSDLYIQDSAGTARQFYFVKDDAATANIQTDAGYPFNTYPADIINKTILLTDVEGNESTFIFVASGTVDGPALITSSPARYTINVYATSDPASFVEFIRQSVLLAFNNGHININPGSAYTGLDNITLTMETLGDDSNGLTITGDAIGDILGTTYITVTAFSGGTTYQPGITWFNDTGFDLSANDGLDFWLVNCANYDTSEEMASRIYEAISVANRTQYTAGGFKDPFILQNTGSASTSSFTFKQMIGGTKGNMTLGGLYDYTQTPTLYSVQLVTSGAQSNDELVLGWFGGRDGIGGTSGRAVYGNELISSNITHVTNNPDMTCHISHSMSDNGVSPYLIMPGDKLIFGWQSPIASGSDLNHGAYDVSNVQSGSFEILPGAGRIVLYGSFLCNDRQDHNITSNQPITSDNIHEALYSDTDIYDVYDTDPYMYHSGSTLDDFVSGSMTSGNRGLVSRATRGDNVYRPNNINNAIINKRSSFFRGHKTTDTSEQNYDSMVPELSSLMAADSSYVYSPMYTNSNSIQTNTDSSVILLGHPSLNSTQAVNDHHKSIWSKWISSYPFEPRYSNITRTTKIKMKNVISSMSGSQHLSKKPVNAVWLVNSLGTFVSQYNNTDKYVSLDMLNIIDGGHLLSSSQDTTNNINNKHQPYNMQYSVITNNEGKYNRNLDFNELDFSNSQMGTQTSSDDIFFAKLFFGTGNAPYKFPKLPYWKNSRVKSGQGYSPSETFITTRGIIIRGFRYGLSNVVPSYSSVILRRDHFGHFRDMLEQRPYTRFFGDGNITEGPVYVTFVERGTDRKIDPESTNSSNLDIYCTSSLPYSDGLNTDRLTLQPDILQKVNISFDVGII